MSAEKHLLETRTKTIEKLRENLRILETENRELRELLFREQEENNELTDKIRDLKREISKLNKGMRKLNDLQNRKI